MIDSLNNVLKDSIAAADELEELSKHLIFDSELISNNSGWEISIVGMIIVFASLALLSLFLIFMSKVLRRKEKVKSTSDKILINEKGKEEFTGETSAAIAMALYLYMEEQHDVENTILTIQRVNKAYSPWSSKIYGLRKNPRI